MNRLAQIILIVRGLLAEPTGDEDMPYEPVILKSLTDKEALDGFDKLTTGFAGSADRAEQAGRCLPHGEKIGGLKPTLQSHGKKIGGLKPTLQSVVGGTQHVLQDLLKIQKPPLLLSDVDLNGEPDTLRKQLSDAISDYSQRHNCKPGIVCLRGLGILYVDQANQTKHRVKRGKEPPVKLGAKYLAPRSTWGSDLPLRNKVALVTGAAGAIGYGICRGLLENGCYLAATDLAGKKLDDFVADLKQTGGDRGVGVPIERTV